MPKILLSVPETTESVTRPVTLDVIRDLMSLTEISSKTNIAFYGDMERSKQLNSAIGSLKDDPNKFAHNDKITIEVSEVYEPDRVMNDVIVGPENLLIFNDPALDVTMKPAYGYISTSITVKYRASNHNQAQQWHQHMKARISQRRSVNIHTVAYSYGIPELEMLILKEIHRLRENVAPYGDDFDTYFANHRHPKMTMLTNLSGAAKMWAMPESQTRIQGWFDFELPEPSSKAGNADAVETSFTYKFGYSRPEGVMMTYPLVVHNQVIDQKYHEEPLRDHNDIIKSYALQTRVLTPFEGSKETLQQQQDYGFAIPTWDEFFPEAVPIKTRRLVTAMFTIDTEAADPNLWLNLTDLGDRQFHPDILEYMRSEAQYMANHSLSAIHISLYRDTLPVTPPPFTITSDLDIIGNTPLQLRRQHHLRISLLTDWYMLSLPARGRLQEHGRAAQLMLLALDPTLADRGFLPALVGDNFITKAGLNIALENMRPGTKPLDPLIVMQTVQSFFIEAHHVETI